MVYFNSKQYSFANIKVVMLGRPVIGLRGIEYSISKEKEVVYGQGEDPQGVQHGNKSYKGTITLLQSELEALQTYAKSQGFDDCLDFEFDIVVAYVPKVGTPIVTNTVKFASITEIPKSMKQGDKFMEVALPFIALGIK